MTKTCKVLGVKEEIDILDVVIWLKKKSDDLKQWLKDGWSVAQCSVDDAGVLTVRLKYKDEDEKEPRATERFDLFDLAEIFCRQNLAWVKDGDVTKLLVL